MERRHEGAEAEGSEQRLSTAEVREPQTSAGPPAKPAGSLLSALGNRTVQRLLSERSSPAAGGHDDRPTLQRQEDDDFEVIGSGEAVAAGAAASMQAQTALAQVQTGQVDDLAMAHESVMAAHASTENAVGPVRQSGDTQAWSLLRALRQSLLVDASIIAPYTGQLTQLGSVEAHLENVTIPFTQELMSGSSGDAAP